MKRCSTIHSAVVCLVSLVVSSSGALAQSKAKAQNVSEIPFDSVANFFKMPANIYFGEGIGVATNSKGTQGNVYVADGGNNRIQVFDSEGTPKLQMTNIGTPAAICISPGSHQYLYSSNSNTTETLDNGEIYKLELDGRIVGKFGRAGRLPKEFGMVNAIDCRSDNDLFVGELTNWRVQKLTLRPIAAQTASARRER